MLVLIVSGFLAAVFAPWVNRVAGRASGAVLALAPLAMFVYFAMQLPSILSGETATERQAWVPALHVELSFFLDGLALLFALLITGIGTLIVWYAGAYLEGHRDRGRFYGWLLLFMASMLGLVIADNVITLFIFWELTSISSYFLIGFDHHRESARKFALQALLVTGLGGLALFAGLIMMAIIGESWELSILLNEGDVFREHALYLPILVLVLLGAFTKSAQFPFHFWLPNAMEAPTPVSAYLHSSTMVKAGVYLLARMSPALGGTELWMIALTVFGGVTMIIGAYLAIRQVHLKKILAYSTISALGILVFLTGLASAPESPLAKRAAVAFAVFLLAHALYKATLFLIAGTITHETDEKDVRKLGGLRRAMPMTAVAAALAGLSMAGVPPFFGFIGKELLLEVTLHHPAWSIVLTTAAGLAGFFFVIVALLIAWRPFFGATRKTPQTPHEASLPMWISPMMLGAAGLAIGLAPGSLAGGLVSMTAAAMIGDAAEKSLALWHGLNLPLLISAGLLVLGLLAYWRFALLSRLFAPLDVLNRIGPSIWYGGALRGLTIVASIQTRFLQSGYLRMYLLITVTMTVGLVGWALLQMETLPLLVPQPAEHIGTYIHEHFFMLIIAAAMLGGTYGAVHSRSRLSAIASLGTVGYGVALIYTFYGAPDLAITQFLIETLTVLLFVLVFYHLPEYPRISNLPARVRDIIVASGAGVTMTVLVLIAANVQTHEKISDWFAQQSYTQGHGRNVVNVILVDFRALDTLGEIIVLAISAMGVFALLKLHPGRYREAKKEAGV